MAVNIENFIDSFAAGGARPSLYKVAITKNTHFKNEDPETLQYLCKNASLPASNIGQIPVSFLGRQVKLPGTRTYEDLSLTFYNDENFGLRNLFEKWAHAMGQFKTPFNNKVLLTGEGKATSDITVSQLNKDGSVAYEYKFWYAFPTVVAAIDLGFDQAEAVEEFTVTMAYSYFNIPTNASGEAITDPT